VSVKLVKYQTQKGLSFRVMPRLATGIHVFAAALKSWMAGIPPAVTIGFMPL